MKIKALYSSNQNFLNDWSWEVAFVGSSIDDRGNVSINYLTNKVSKIITFNYNPDDITIDISGEIHDKDLLDDYLKDFLDLRLILDTTTLGVSELLILLQSFKNIGCTHLSLLYLEPTSYRKKYSNKFITDSDEEVLFHRRDFELSDVVRGFIGIPGHALSMSSISRHKVVFLCGFESQRVDQAIEDLYIVTNNCYCVFGVPAFTAGWEMDAFANHIDVLTNRGLQDIIFCSATNPIATYEKLEHIFSSIDSDASLFIAPLATKPMSIGACLFLVDKEKTRVAALFDHPIKKKGRADDVSNWNLYEIDF
ncbi:hypothetical protein [Spirosoma gilvum]